MKKVFLILILVLILLFPMKEEILSINLPINKKIVSTWTIEIEKINLFEKFYDNDNVDRNIIVIHPSKYPNIKKSTLILAAHSGTSKYAYFDDLYKLRISDEVIIRNYNNKYVYKIVNIYNQNKTGNINIYKDNSKTILVLVTCTNNNHSSQTIYICELIN